MASTTTESAAPAPELPTGLDLPYPARTRQAAGTVNGVPTDVMMVWFADKIVVTIAQNGRLAQWLHVALDQINPATENGFSISTESYDDEDDDGANDPDSQPSESLLPMTHLTATPTLGSADSERDTMGQLYARQIASAILAQDPEEKRLVVVGLGIAKVDLEREGFFAVLELVLRCL